MTTTAGGSLLVAADLFDTTALKYRHDPVAFVHDVFTWKPGQAPTDYQDEGLSALVEYGRVAERGPHGIGKTADEAWAILWFALTSDLEGLDWKNPSTASAWRQLTHYLWPEIRKWAKMIRWDKVGRKAFTRYELLHQNLKLSTGEAFPVASDDPATIEGAHADRILYVIDEAKTVPVETWDAIEGAFSGAGEDTPLEALAFACSTPGAPVGRFYEIHARKPGYEDWHTIHVTIDRAIASGRISRKWADQRAKQWGTDSAVFKNRVLGEFAASEEDGVIPLEWVELAIERWRALHEAGSLVEMFVTRIGVDHAKGGADKTVLAYRAGNVITRLERFDRDRSTMNTANHIAPKLIKGVTAIIDVAPSGVVDRLKEMNLSVVGFNAAERTDRKDRSGELGFANRRAFAWWNLRELLDPDSGEDVALPPDDLLIGDLCAPKWRQVAGGRILIESKDEIRKRLGRSTDTGDAVVQSFVDEAGYGTTALFNRNIDARRGGMITAGLLTADF